MTSAFYIKNKGEDVQAGSQSYVVLNMRIIICSPDQPVTVIILVQTKTDCEFY